jgi:hypothetical protein
MAARAGEAFHKKRPAPKGRPLKDRPAALDNGTLATVTAVGYTTPWSIIASATLRKPPMLAPFT